MSKVFSWPQMIAANNISGIDRYLPPVFYCRLDQVRVFWLLFRLALMVVFLSSTISHAQDYAREQRLADEILPGLLVGDPIRLPARDGRSFLGILSKGKTDLRPIILVHGVGTHPDAGVIGQLRQALNDLGHTTLSIQMPVQGRAASLEDYYPSVFAEAKERIGQAVKWMAEQGESKPALLSHAMGSWMANEYLDEHHRRAEFSAWICMSLTGGYSWTARSFALPVLDLYAESDIPAAVSSAWRRSLALTGIDSRQLQVKGAAPDYSGYERAVATEISRFLR